MSTTVFARHWTFTLIFSFLLGLFIFLRSVNLPSTLEFMADMGRDHYVLSTWKTTGKPPLLGPSNSALPINQSPIYFYLLYPVFLFSGSSAYSSVIATNLLYVIFLCVGAYFFRASVHRWRYLLVVFFIAIHPQLILQLRNPWNPSFVFPFFFTSLVLLLVPEIAVKRWSPFFAALGIVMSIGFSYSLVPAGFLIFLASLYVWRMKKVLLFCGYLVGAVLIFSPLVFFEIRHGFFFIHRLLLDSTIIGDKSTGLLGNIYSSLSIIFGTQNLWSIGAFLGIIGTSLWFARSSKQLLFAIVTFTIVLVSTSLSPIQIAPHYIFGILAGFFVLLFFLPVRAVILVLITSSLTWMTPEWMNIYQAPIHRTISEMNSCAQIVCRDQKGPMFVTQESWYPYHYSPEYLFFFSRNGCRVADIGAKPDFSSTMAVVADHASYDHGKTAFHELTVFGKANVVKTYQCSDHISVTILQK